MRRRRTGQAYSIAAPARRGGAVMLPAERPSASEASEAAEAAPRRPYPSKLFVEVTTRCNLSCAMCVKQAAGHGIAEGDMTDETFDALSPAFAHLDTLVLNGIGEPLLHRGLERFVAAARGAMPSSGWIGFQTNGQLIGPRRARSLVDAGVDTICMSVDSTVEVRLEAIHGGAHLHPIEAAARRLMDASRESGRALSLGLEFVAMRDNVGDLTDIVRWAAARGFEFVIVTHMLPYDPSTIDQAAFSPTSDRALEIYRRWRDRAAAAGVDIGRYFESFMRFSPSETEERTIAFVRRMTEDAAAQGISLRVADLIAFDETRLAQVEDAFGRAKEAATELGLDLRLPATVPTQVRRCEFVEEGSAFVSWDGDVHPCYFLWHTFDCHLGGMARSVRPRSFGNARDGGILSIWNSPEFRDFRDTVLRYDFPFCYDCNVAMCDYMQDPEFEQDCHVVDVPCAGCLWCTGPFQCLS